MGRGRFEILGRVLIGLTTSMQAAGSSNGALA